MVTLVLLILGGVLIALIRTDGYDFFWYLGAGNMMHNTGDMVNPFTAEGLPWHNHEWLFHWILGLAAKPSVYHLSLKFLLVELILLSLFFLNLQKSKGNPLLAAFFALLSCILIGEFIDLRAQLASYLFFVLTWIVLTSRINAKHKAIWLLPIMVLWANMHGGFVLGIALVIWHQGYHYIAARVRKQRTESFFWLPIVIALLAPLINPYFIEVYSYPLKWSGNAIYKEHIREWTSVLKWKTYYIPYFIYIIALGSTLIIAKFKKPLELIPLIIFVLLPLSAVRHLAFLYLFSSPILTESLSKIGESVADNSEKRSSIQWSWGVLILILIIVRGYSIYTKPITRVTDPIFQKYVYPTGAVAFIIDNKLDGKILNAYQWGGYLWWRGFNIFIDGRLDTLYPLDVFQDYTDIVSTGSNWRENLEKWDISLVLLDTRLKGKTPKLISAMSSDNQWVLLYQDPVATLFARKENLEPSFLENHAKGAIAIPDEPMCQYAAGMSVFNRGGKHNDAIRYLRRAIELDYAFAQPRVGLARVFIDQRKYADAIEQLRIAKKLGVRGKEVDDLWEIAMTHEKSF